MYLYSNNIKYLYSQSIQDTVHYKLPSNAVSLGVHVAFCCISWKKKAEWNEHILSKFAALDIQEMANPS